MLPEFVRWILYAICFVWALISLPKELRKYKLTHDKTDLFSVVGEVLIIIAIPLLAIGDLK